MKTLRTGKVEMVAAVMMAVRAAARAVMTRAVAARMVKTVPFRYLQHGFGDE